MINGSRSKGSNPNVLLRPEDAVGRVVADSVPVQNPVLGCLLPSQVPSSPAAEAPCFRIAYRPSYLLTIDLAERGLKAEGKVDRGWLYWYSFDREDWRVGHGTQRNTKTKKRGSPCELRSYSCSLNKSFLWTLQPFLFLHKFPWTQKTVLPQIRGVIFFFEWERSFFLEE